jgi:hypothetical protein
MTRLLLAASVVLACVLGNPIRPPPPPNGLTQILAAYNLRTPWLPSFSTGIIPNPCQSYNDYAHKISLYEGLAAGCVSTEVDIYASNKGTELSVAHKAHKLERGRTLRSLYLDLLKAILEGQNSGNVNASELSGVLMKLLTLPLLFLWTLKMTLKMVLERHGSCLIAN